jgi:hypothetical protein
MNVEDAKKLVLDGILRDVPQAIASGLLDPASPDPSDAGKFTLARKPARVIHHWSGWHVKINLDWFRGSFDMPRINRLPFHWYAFAIPSFHRRSPHYLICDYLQVRDWVLEFAAPKGVDHRDHDDWMANIHVDADLSRETQAYFRWGDEPLAGWTRTSRIVRLDNAATVVEHAVWEPQGKYVGTTGSGGESEAHRRLKLYVARSPELLQMRPDAVSELEHEFCTGDRVDLLLENHRPLRAVVEVELGGEQNLIVGVHQAIKYRSLAAAERTMPLDTPKVRAFVVSYDPGGDSVCRLAQSYDVGLLAVDRERVLAPTG